MASDREPGLGRGAGRAINDNSMTIQPFKYQSLSCAPTSSSGDNQWLNISKKSTTPFEMTGQIFVKGAF